MMESQGAHGTPYEGYAFAISLFRGGNRQLISIKLIVKFYSLRCPGLGFNIKGLGQLAF